ncbi:CPBP family intramembrane glutamic endopeptidase [Amycolatopsis magusensis]|uniref:Membrane protease YdiL (CAAX protease family) n=1 Tax=Amycolatopsis magusensis TaxID=882444 RepID=A0ABS4PJK0_9PSEU|nr:type II CAAX endopeptidase family protein [Amycolatopsis magusensis]MBP2179586.1 membrane protease YdiL (CAAX protease family) [Amycolatopsis magusensis]MDI5982600.1 type II CAAX endopeptidase family protein [Amycolatopsis magusensis]
MRSWLISDRPAAPEVVTDPARRRLLKFELLIVFGITLGLSGVRSLLSLLDSLLRPEPLNEQQVALNVPQAAAGLIDLLKQLLSATQLVGWGALGVYLLYRGGMKLAEVGFDRTRPRRDLLWGAGLTALIGIPGLVLYFVGWQLGFNLAVQPSTLTESWWRPITLTLSAFGNAFAEEVLVVGYLLTRLRQLGWKENSSLFAAAVLRGSYHLYQGLGGFVGNLVMGLVFGRIWQKTNRLWPLVVAHTLLDVVAFVGYALLRGKVSFLP